MKKIITITLSTVVALSTILTVAADNLAILEEARDIILKRHPSAQIHELEMDYERGVAVYEAEYYSDGVKYDVDIDAATGQVIREKVKNKNYNNNYNNQGRAASTTAQTAYTDIMTMEEAKVMAVAAVNASDAVFVDEEFDYNKRGGKYEFEIIANGYKYDCEINAVTGAVEKLKQKSVNATANVPTYLDVIDVEYAKEIATDNAGVYDATFTEVKFKDKKKGAIYKIEFVSGGMEYEYEIDAASGTVLKHSAEYNKR